VVANFKRYIKNIVPITDNEFDLSMEYFKTITLNKGDNFVLQNKVCKQIGFINDGLLRTYYTNEKGEEITSCFCTKHNLTTSYKSFIVQSPSTITITALEQTELLVINYDDLQKLYSKIPVWQTVGRVIAEKEYIVMEQYASVLNNESAKEKYLRLLKEQPEIIQKSPVNYIASYLGITRRTLSRIRKEITI